MFAISISIAYIVVLLFQATMRSAGHKRGRELPWNVPVKMQPPAFRDARITKMADRLVTVSILGILLIGGAAGYLIGTFEGGTSSVVYVLGAVGFLMVSSRSMFVSAAWAYAELDSVAPAETA